jgi:putative nucleotidyltransferase with HDIG domain
MRPDYFRRSIVFSLILLFYFVAGKLGLQLAIVNDSATAVWAPTGIALASLLFFGYRYWPAILAGAFLVNLTTTGAIISSFVIAIGNTLEGLIGSYLVNRFADGQFFYKHSLNVKKFVFFAAILATAVSASVGLLTLILSGAANWSNAGVIWFTWWVGDAVGAIIVTPLLLLLADKEFKPLTRNQAVERVLFLICVFGVSIIVFARVFQNHPVGFLLIPLFVWPGLRFSQQESVIATFIISGTAVWATVSGIGPFIHSYPKDTLLMLQAYIAVVSLTSLILAAAVSERKEAQAKLSVAYDQALEGWSKTLDLRDKEIEGHAQRVAVLAVKLAEAVGLSGQQLINIRRGALLHDIGKMALPDNVLFKHGELTNEEREIVKKHTVYAHNLLLDIPYFKDSMDIPYCHHEKWDGTGYPRGLKGAEIPLSARIFTIVDVWDALHSDRPYRAAWTDEEVLEHIVSLSGKDFDPELLDKFLALLKKEAMASEVKGFLHNKLVKQYNS